MNNFSHLFIDESGKSDLLDTRYVDFILTGVLIGDSELPIISGYFSFIKRKYKLPQDTPFHSYHLLEDPHSSYRLKTRQIPMFMESMQEFLQLIPLTIYVVHTNKVLFKKTYGIDKKDLSGSKENKERNGILYYLSSLVMFTRVAKKLEAVGISCAIHTDSRKYLDTQLLKAFVDIKEPTLKTKADMYVNGISASAKRLCSIEFANKTALSAGLELADFISYVTFAQIRNKTDRLHVSTVWPFIHRKLLNKKFIIVSRDFGRMYI